MSAETYTALEQAIQAHVQDETGDLTGAWIVLTETTNLTDYDADRATWQTTKKGSHFTIRGLLESQLDVTRGTQGDDDDLD